MSFKTRTGLYLGRIRTLERKDNKQGNFQQNCFWTARDEPNKNPILTKSLPSAYNHRAMG